MFKACRDKLRQNDDRGQGTSAGIRAIENSMPEPSKPYWSTWLCQVQEPSALPSYGMESQSFIGTGFVFGIDNLLQDLVQVIFCIGQFISQFLHQLPWYALRGLFV